MLVRYDGYIFTKQKFVEQIVEIKGFWYEDSIECCILYASEGMNNIALPMSVKQYTKILDLVEQRASDGCSFINLKNYDAFEFSVTNKPDIEEVDTFKNLMKTRHDAELAARSTVLTSSIEANKQSTKIQRDGYIGQNKG